MEELKPCDINLLEKRLKNLNTGLEKMCSHAEIAVNNAMLTAVRDYMQELLTLRFTAQGDLQAKSWAADTLEELIPKIEDSMILVECERVALHEGVYALHRNNTQWISVSKRPPKKSDANEFGDVLACNQTVGSVFNCAWNIICDSPAGITHWMRLPQPPDPRKPEESTT